MAVELPFELTNTTLTEAIIAETKRTDDRFVNHIPMFKAMGQRRIAVDLRLVGSQEVADFTLQVGNPYVQKPNRWRLDSAANMGVGPDFTELKILYPTSQSMAWQYGSRSEEQGEPKYYCSTLEQNLYFFAPRPDRPYPVQIQYYETPELLSDLTQTNFYTSGIPRMLLYASLLETAPFLQDDPRLPMWKEIYDGEKGSLAVEEDLRQNNFFQFKGEA